MRWDDVNARARGLGTHLLTREDLSALSGARSWEEFLLRLVARGYPLPSAAPVADAEQLDRTIGDVTAARLAVLSRWLGDRQDALGVVYELEERQAVRALLRGVVQGLSPGGRLHAVTPTPTLPRAALQQLATATSPIDLAKGLLKLGHPAGRALDVALARPVVPGLLGLELAITRTFAVRATRAARRGGRVLCSFIAWVLDLENAWALLQAPEWGAEVQAGDIWLPGGRLLPLKRFTDIASAEPGQVRTALASAFSGSPFADLFAVSDQAGAGVERRVLEALIAWSSALVRVQPLGPAGVLLVVMRIRAEAHDLRALAWGIALGAPAEEIAASLASER